MQELQLLSPLHRCPFCFSEVETGIKKPCSNCLAKERFCNYVGSCFDYIGPARSLVKEFKYSDQPHLAKSLAGFMMIQFQELKWPTPDLITFVPSTLRRLLERGYNQSALLAKAFGELVERPIVPLLKKTQNLPSQTYLNRSYRKNLNCDLFQLKKKTLIADKIILLIDDVYTTGATLEASAQALLEGYPKRIYGLTLCHAGE
jgi:competence protein ComFC